MIRDGILLSERLNAVSTMAELHYRRLMSVVDDYGRFEASPAVVRGACWSMRENVTSQDVDNWQVELGSGERPLVLFYDCKGKKYLEIQDFGQRIRTDRKGTVAASRCPAPDVAATRGDTRRHAADSRDAQNVAAERGMSPSCAASSTELAISLTQDALRSRVGVRVPGFVPHVERFMLEYPREVNQVAQQLFISVVGSIDDQKLLFANLALYVETDEWRRGMVPAAQRWLSEGSWKIAPKRGNPKPQTAPQKVYKCGECGDTGNVVVMDDNDELIEKPCEKCGGKAAA